MRNTHSSCAWGRVPQNVDIYDKRLITHQGADSSYFIPPEPCIIPLSCSLTKRKMFMLKDKSYTDAVMLFKKCGPGD